MTNILQLQAQNMRSVQSVTPVQSVTRYQINLLKCFSVTLCLIYLVGITNLTNAIKLPTIWVYAHTSGTKFTYFIRFPKPQKQKQPEINIYCIFSMKMAFRAYVLLQSLLVLS